MIPTSVYSIESGMSRDDIMYGGKGNDNMFVSAGCDDDRALTRSLWPPASRLSFAPWHLASPCLQLSLFLPNRLTGIAWPCRVQPLGRDSSSVVGLALTSGMLATSFLSCGRACAGWYWKRPSLRRLWIRQPVWRERHGLHLLGKRYRPTRDEPSPPFPQKRAEFPLRQPSPRVTVAGKDTLEGGSGKDTLVSQEASQVQVIDGGQQDDQVFLSTPGCGVHNFVNAEAVYNANNAMLNNCV